MDIEIRNDASPELAKGECSRLICMSYPELRGFLMSDPFEIWGKRTSEGCRISGLGSIIEEMLKAVADDLEIKVLPAVPKPAKENPRLRAA